MGGENRRGSQFSFLVTPLHAYRPTLHMLTAAFASRWRGSLAAVWCRTSATLISSTLSHITTGKSLTHTTSNNNYYYNNYNNTHALTQTTTSTSQRSAVSSARTRSALTSDSPPYRYDL